MSRKTYLSTFRKQLDKLLKPYLGEVREEVLLTLMREIRRRLYDLQEERDEPGENSNGGVKYT